MYHLPQHTKALHCAHRAYLCAPCGSRSKRHYLVGLCFLWSTDWILIYHLDKLPPASRKRRGEGSPVVSDLYILNLCVPCGSRGKQRLGHPVPGGYKYGNLALQVGGISDETVKYGYGFCATRTIELLQCKLQTRPFVREGAPQKQDRNFQTPTFRPEVISGRKSHKGARYQDILTDWLSLVKLLRASTSVCKWEFRIYHIDSSVGLGTKRRSTGEDQQQICKSVNLQSDISSLVLLTLTPKRSQGYSHIQCMKPWKKINSKNCCESFSSALLPLGN
jgi:hypothetical protein